MLFSARRSLWPVVMLGGLLAGSPASALTSGVEDGADFFSTAAVQKARDEIKQIKSQFNKDLLIETFKTIPADRKNGQNLQGAARRQFFKKWVDDQVKETKLHGIYVLITRSPGHVEVGVSEDTLKKGFPVVDRDKLSKLLLEKFQAKQYDAGLLDGVRLVHDTLAKNLPAPLPSPVVNAVKDYGGFFKSEVVQKADAELQDIHNQTKKNILFETFKKAPTTNLQRLEAMTAQERRKYFGDWMRSRVQGLRFDIYVLITREPSHLQVAIGPEVEKSAFTPKDRDQLNEILLSGFKDKEYDQGLKDALGYIRKTLYAHLDIATTPPRTISTARATTRTSAATARTGSMNAAEMKKATPATNADTQKTAGGAAAAVGGNNPQPPSKAQQLADGFKPIWILWIVLGLLGLWILFGIIRGLMHRRQQMPPGGYPPPGPGYAPGTGQRVVGPNQPVSGPHYASGQPMPPPGAPGYGPGYGPGQPMGGYGPGAPYGGGGGGGGGGFLTGMLGGMFGAAAGSWVYDSFVRKPQSGGGGGFGPRAYGAEPQGYNNPPPVGGETAGTAAGAGAGGFSSTGGDFDASSGQPVETSGGDFDAGDNQGDTGAGGDFGGNAAADAGAGGDFGHTTEDAGSGGDFGGTTEADSGGGGDFGGDAGGSDDTSGGDFGGDSGGDAGGGGDSGGDAGGGDAGGGDF